MTIVANVSQRPLLPLLLALSGGHLLNDLIASMIPAMYPLLKEAYRLDFTQIGLITLAFHVTSSLLQPVLGHVTDHKPWAYAMVVGMGSTLLGVVGLSSASNYAMVLVSVALVGLGSAVFHPEATRMARHAAANQQGFAQGIFQIGGHVGYAAGPLLAAMIVVPRGQTSIAWMSVVALVAMVLMAWTGARYAEMRSAQIAATKERPKATTASILPGWPILMAMAVLGIVAVFKFCSWLPALGLLTFLLPGRHQPIKAGVRAETGGISKTGYRVWRANGRFWITPIVLRSKADFCPSARQYRSGHDVRSRELQQQSRSRCPLLWEEQTKREASRWQSLTRTFLANDQLVSKGRALAVLPQATPGQIGDEPYIDVRVGRCSIKKTATTAACAARV